MADIFRSIPGKVVRISSPTQTASITLSDLNLSEFVLITSAQLSLSGNIQYKPTLSNKIFVYPLGDRMGKFVIQGAAFDDKCDNSQGGGFKTILDYYRSKRATKSGIPITISLQSSPDAPFEGFLESLEARLAGSEGLTYWTWSMVLGTLPQDRS